MTRSHVADAVAGESVAAKMVGGRDGARLVKERKIGGHKETGDEKRSEQATVETKESASGED